MATVIFYNFILLSSTFFVWLSEKGRTKIDRWFLLGIAFLLVFVPSAIRYDIGTDYLAYINIFEDPTRLEGYKLKEPAFYFVNWFLNELGLSAQWAIATFAFIFTAVAFKAYPRKNAWVLHLLFFSFLWFYSFTAIRQTISLVFILLALICFFNKKNIWFFVLALAASLFHQSAIFFFIIGFLSYIPLSHTFKIRVVPVVFISIITLVFIYNAYILFAIEYFLNIIGFVRYSNYFCSKHFISVDFGTGLAALAKLLMSIFILVNTGALLDANKRYWPLLIIVFLYGLGVALAMQIAIFARMSAVFMPGLILGTYIIYQIKNKNVMFKIYFFIVLLFIVSLNIKTSFGIPNTYNDPKLNPYQTIFEVE